jgi:hypothetical protein
MVKDKTIQITYRETQRESYMKVILCWSGDRGKAVAIALHEWIPNVIQAVEPWMSEEDIEKGSRWESKLDNELSSADFGILCMTPESAKSLWIHFEAGVLGRNPSSFKYRLNLFRLLSLLEIFQDKPNLCFIAIPREAVLGSCGERDTREVSEKAGKKISEQWFTKPHQVLELRIVILPSQTKV